MRFRFSLRRLLLATLIVAGLCYWFIRPGIVARRFVAAVASKDFALADSYFCDSADRFLFDEHEKRWHFGASAFVEAWSFAEVVRGKRMVLLQIMSADAGPMRHYAYSIVVTRSGLLNPRPLPVRGGSGFGGIADQRTHPTATSPAT